MKMDVGETKKRVMPSDYSKVPYIGICYDRGCMNSFCPNHLEGYIYNVWTGRPVKHATIVVENEYGCEACITDSRGYYKISMPCKNTWCQISIKKHNFYKHYAANIYIKESKIDFKMCPK